MSSSTSSPSQTDLSGQFRALAERTTMLRGNLGYGRKPNRSVIERIAQFQPVDIVHANPDGHTFTVETVSDPRPILDANVRDQNSGHDFYTKDRSMRLVARLQPSAIIMLLKRGINPYRNEDWAAVVAMLDDPEFRKFRVGLGKMGRKPHRHYVVPAGRR